MYFCRCQPDSVAVLLTACFSDLSFSSHERRAVLLQAAVDVTKLGCPFFPAQTIDNAASTGFTNTNEGKVLMPNYQTVCKAT